MVQSMWLWPVFQLPYLKPDVSLGFPTWLEHFFFSWKRKMYNSAHRNSSTLIWSSYLLQLDRILLLGSQKFCAVSKKKNPDLNVMEWNYIPSLFISLKKKKNLGQKYKTGLLNSNAYNGIIKHTMFPYKSWNMSYHRIIQARAGILQQSICTTKFKWCRLISKRSKAIHKDQKQAG